MLDKKFGSRWSIGFKTKGLSSTETGSGEGSASHRTSSEKGEIESGTGMWKPVENDSSIIIIKIVVSASV